VDKKMYYSRINENYINYNANTIHLLV